ncbi:hypothetical protein PWT90_02540 [Aphanocladium album]|nr:hypothetical protein PWT90_02540 [Aphanocladium album]
MTSIISGNSQNTFLSLRARLRTPECSQQFSGRVTKAAQLDGCKIQEYLQRELIKILAAHRDPSNRKDGTSLGENYSLLEQLAYSLAVTGANLHQQIIIEIDNSHDSIQQKIEELASASGLALAKSAALYELIGQPLTELSHGSPAEEEDGVAEQVASLQEEFFQAGEKLDSLHEQWQACVRAEQDAWKRLTDEDKEPRQELELQEFVDAMEEIMASGEADINNIEAEYAEYIQIESLKVMQTLMEG